MVGLSELVELYQASPPALLALIFLTLTVGWRQVIKPRMDAIEAALERHDDRWDDQELSARERDILLAHHDEAVDDIRERVRSLEQDFAVEHGYTPRPGRQHDSAAPDVDRDGGIIRRPDDPHVTDGGQPVAAADDEDDDTELEDTN